MGSNPRLPTGLPPQPLHPLALRREARGRMPWPRHVHLARQRPICRSRPTEFARQNGHPEHRLHHRTPDETLHHLPRHLARRLLRRLPIHPQRLGGNHAFW